MWTVIDTTKAADRGSRTATTLASQLPELEDGDQIIAGTVAHRQKTSAWRSAGYAVLSLLLAASLIAQIGYPHLDRLSQHETLRPWLLSFCQTLQCILPIRQDSSLIASRGLSIGPHPDYQNLSLMTLTFTNTAAFPQPLPAIELNYSDVAGQTVAARRVYPRQYLSESSAAQAAFALSPGENVNAQLEFATPTADAVNYQVRFVYE